MPGYGFLLAIVVFSVAECYVGSETDPTGCPRAFQGRCHCGPSFYKDWTQDNDKQPYLTNCTNTGFNNTAMLEYLSEETQVLIFTGNHLEIFPWNVLGIFYEHKKLTIVDLTNNGIKKFQGKSFHKVTNVKRLILNHNDLYIASAMHHSRTFSNFINLEELHLTNAFTEQIDSEWYLSDLKDIFMGSQLNKLRVLHLEQNEIWKIEDDDMFCTLPNLGDLHLGDNQLTDINFSLECMKKLRYLGLEYNKITNLANKTLNKIEKAFTNKTNGRMINLEGNPYKCDCLMMPFYDWLKSTKVTLVNKDDYRCWNGEPVTNAGKRIKNLQKLNCSPTDGTEKEDVTLRHAWRPGSHSGP